MALSERADERLGLQEAYFGLLQTSKAFHTVREHGTPSCLLIYNITGCAYFRHARGELISMPGDVVLLAPGVRQEYGARASGKGNAYIRLFAHFQPRPEWREYLQWPEPAPGIQLVSAERAQTRNHIERCLREAVAYGMRHEARGEAFAMNALERAILWCDAEAPKANAPVPDSRIMRALDYLTHHFDQPMTVEGLASYCGLSVSRFCWLFREGVRDTPQRYLENLRINRARQLLRLTPNPVKEIAEECGYTDPFYFSLRFKRRTGLSPRAYRQRYGNAGSA